MKVGNQYRYPVFQFDRARRQIRPGAEHTTRLMECDPDPWGTLDWWFTENPLIGLPGFLHLTWWEHPDDRMWFNECSFWASKEALYDWHTDTYHKHAKAWAANGAIMEDIITNFELVGNPVVANLSVLQRTSGQGVRARSGAGGAA
ncbi:hypothetical protein MPY17_20880 [Rhodococcus opacus]|uniref:antibiotic biosynthesis monooxygenase family protein n=1 Tax=Rhodococcus opacus TaxID=37919 RepID=UPI001FF4719A|nr:hypothetical protein [Rhodococcus opacus]UOT01460.1 hypothetical protein MPY17_20880 [Rhodococcus opacus]